MTNSEQLLRVANRLGAFALHVGDQVTETTVAVAGPANPAAIVALARGRREPIVRLKQLLGLSHPATVRVVDRLTERGLAQRSGGADRRNVIPVPTQQGRLVADSIQRQRLEALVAVVAELPEVDLDHLERILDLLLKDAAADTAAASHICRLCDFKVCEAQGDCPVDFGVASRSESVGTD